MNNSFTSGSNNYHNRNSNYNNDTFNEHIFSSFAIWVKLVLIGIIVECFFVFFALLFRFFSNIINDLLYSLHLVFSLHLEHLFFSYFFDLLSFTFFFVHILGHVWY